MCSLKDSCYGAIHPSLFRELQVTQLMCSVQLCYVVRVRQCWCLSNISYAQQEARMSAQLFSFLLHFPPI